MPRLTVKAREVRYGGRSWKQGESFEVSSDKDARLLTQMRNAPCVVAVVAPPTPQAGVREPVFEPPKPNPLSPPPPPAPPATPNRFGGRQPAPRAWVQPNVTEEDKKLAAEKEAEIEANRYARRDMRAEDE
jgi:hypothetical protein